MNDKTDGPISLCRNNTYHTRQASGGGYFTVTCKLVLMSTQSAVDQM